MDLGFGYQVGEVGWVILGFEYQVGEVGWVNLEFECQARGSRGGRRG